MIVMDKEYISETPSERHGQLIMPFYLIVDVSSSMSPDQEELSRAIAAMVEAIRTDPVVDDLVQLSIITFNHSANTVVPLSFPSDVTAPPIRASGGTNYGAAFHEYHRVYEADRARLKAQGTQVYRSCVFFLTDGEPNDQDHLETFRSLFAYNAESNQGNRAFPYFVPFGFRGASEKVIRRLSYPDFGPTKGRWFLSRSNNVADVLRSMTDVIGRTVISSGLSAGQGQPVIVPPSPAPGDRGQFGLAGDCP